MKVRKITPDVRIFKIQTSGAIGLDLYTNKEVIILTKQREVIPTGIAVEIPRGHYLRLAPWSGLSKKGIDVGAGIIDPDYRGEIKALLINNSSDEIKIKKDDRITQVILEKASVPVVEEVKELEKIEHGEKGFGSMNNVQNMNSDMLVFDGSINKHFAKVLIDSGSSGNFIREDFATKSKIPIRKKQNPY